MSFSAFGQELAPISSANGLRTTIYKVNDIESARVWYAQAFGTEPYFDEPFYVGFNIGGYELGLQPEEAEPDTKTHSVVSYWAVEDIEATYRFLVSIGAKENEPPTNVGGELMTGTVIDPWGNILGIIYNPTFQIRGE
ncbi:MAG TPA: glyoxalase/bleomycin resistance/extradiol dioxygenase family protein [Cytophagales bacterium]|nr:glyoxalase/bleomycin resistance/extradiol dioxygenase family protein [Cytophagales bacterium]HAP58874.1 glyoxalase/bleomycin resistance/extradiol dioxygenase family protein [Cytophagales bacterium]